VLAQGRIGEQANERALQLTNVVLDVLSDELCHVTPESNAVFLRLVLKDGDTGFKIGRLYVHRQAPLETREQPLLYPVDFLWRAVC